MNSSKRENLLNLALDATEEERLQSLNLNVGYQEETDTWEVIVKYTGSLRKLEEIFPDIEVTELSNEYAVIRLPEALMDAVEVSHQKKQKRMRTGQPSLNLVFMWQTQKNRKRLLTILFRDLTKKIKENIK